MLILKYWPRGECKSGSDSRMPGFEGDGGTVQWTSLPTQRYLRTPKMATLRFRLPKHEVRNIPQQPNSLRCMASQTQRSGYFAHISQLYIRCVRAQFRVVNVVGVAMEQLLTESFD